MLDIIIKNALIIDGSGAKAYEGSVGVTGDRITLVCPGACNQQAEIVIDGKGLVCSPGFIDVHSHADVTIPYYPEVYNLVMQGITTFAGGNCGMGMAPAMNPEFYKQYFASLNMSDLDIVWSTFGEWLEYARKLPIKANYAPLVGHNMIRGSVLGRDYARTATDEEISKEALLLCEALDAGALGMSISLDPGIAGHFADQRELNALFEILERREVLLTAHTRHHQNQWPSDDGQNFYGWFIGNKGEAICGRYQGLIEFMEYYRRFPKLRSMIAHLTNAFGVPQPHSLKLEHAMLDETVELLVNQPNREGCDVYFNTIPDEQSVSSSFRVAADMIRNMRYDNSVKDYATEEKMIEGLKDPVFRKKMKDFINGGKFKISVLSPAVDPYWAADYRFVKGKNPQVVGKTLMEITKERMPGTEREVLYNNCIEVLFDILLEDPYIEGAMILDKRIFSTEHLLQNPRSMPITDVFSLPEHPDINNNAERYGTQPIAYNIFTRFLINMCREGRYFKMEEAFRKITSLPAYVLRIPKRGLLKEGHYADITVLNWKALAYKNDFNHPAQPPEGISHVIVNGKFAVREGKLCEGAAGRVLSKLEE